MSTNGVKKLISLMVLLCFFISSCYSMKTATIKDGSEYPLCCSEKEVTVAVDPYWELAKSEGLFTRNMKDQGVLALHVIVNNGSEDAYIFQKASFVCETPPEKQCKLISASVAAEKAKYSSLWIVFPWVVPLISPLGIVISAVVVSNNNNSLVADYHQKEFQEGKVIDPKKNVDGFIFIDYSAKQDIAGTKIKLGFKNVKTQEIITMPFVLREIKIQLDTPKGDQVKGEGSTPSKEDIFKNVQIGPPK